MAQPPAWEDPRRALSRHGLRPSKHFSQNFLVAPHAVDRIAAAASVRDGMNVLEIGPGLGTLTGALLRGGARVCALEPDPNMRAVLDADLAGQPLEVLDADATVFDYTARADALGAPLVVVGNLPYAVTGAILRRLVECRGAISHAVLMVQREVAQRLTALPASAEYGALTVFTGAAFAIQRVMTLSPGSFHPPPAVDSAVVRLDSHTPPRVLETAGFRAVVRAAFQARRKTLRNALRTTGALDDAVDNALAAAAIDGQRRGETLSIEEFGALAAAWDDSQN